MYLRTLQYFDYNFLPDANHPNSKRSFCNTHRLSKWTSALKPRSKVSNRESYPSFQEGRLFFSEFQKGTWGDKICPLHNFNVNIPHPCRVRIVDRKFHREMECFKTNWWCVLGDPSSFANFTLQCKFSLAQVQVKYNSLLLVLALIYTLIITIDMELLLEVCERLYICWYLDLLFQSKSFHLLFSFCSSVFLFLGYLLGRYLHFPLPIIVTFLSRALWCMCCLLRFSFRFYFLCFLPGLLYTWDCDLVLRVPETKYVFQRSLFESSIFPFFP